MSKNKSILTETGPSRLSQPDIKFRPDDFDFAVFDKGLEVVWEKAVPCPCKTKGTQAALSACKNCGGIGWVFINPISTRMMVQALGIKAQFKIWGEESPGTVAITTRNDVKLSYMDRLIVTDSETLFKQVLYPVKNPSGNYIGITVYPLISIESLFLFQFSNQKLKRLVEDTDYTFDYNVITLSSAYSSLGSVNLSVNYTHNIQYHVIENMKDVRNSYVFDPTGKDLLAKLPIHALGRRAHNVLDVENIQGDRLFDNSFTI